MRRPCIDCTIKHLSDAALFEPEVLMGYPQFGIYVIGSLSHASMEIYRYSPELAMTIREYRLRWTEDHTFNIPYEELYLYLCVARVLPEGAEWPALPDALKVSFSGDTRP